MEFVIKVKTKSNLMIGGNEGGFIIGGIDQHTVTKGKKGKEEPYIPGSSFKGALRKIVRDHGSNEISEIYQTYLEGILDRVDVESLEEEQKKQFNKFKQQIKKSTAECLFGIEGMNQSPRLIFSDLYLVPKECEERNSYFSIDSKNSIDDKTMDANPRTYKVARAGLIFKGTIRFQNSDKLSADECQNIIDYVKQKLVVFKEGNYRLGNSKSRGYGEIDVEIVRCSE